MHRDSISARRRYARLAGSADALALARLAASEKPLDATDDEFHLELPDDDKVALGEGPRKSDLKGPSSGIRLDNPLDSGISLEQESEGSDEIDLSLSLGENPTPPPFGSFRFSLFGQITFGHEDDLHRGH